MYLKSMDVIKKKKSLQNEALPDVYLFGLFCFFIELTAKPYGALLPPTGRYRAQDFINISFYLLTNPVYLKI